MDLTTHAMSELVTGFHGNVKIVWEGDACDKGASTLTRPACCKYDFQRRNKNQIDSRSRAPRLSIHYDRGTSPNAFSMEVDGKATSFEYFDVNADYDYKDEQGYIMEALGLLGKKVFR